MKNLKVVNTHLGLFDYTIRCVIGDYGDSRKYIKKVYGGYIHDSSINNEPPRGQCFHKLGYVPTVWIPDYPKTPREYATLAHETVHAALHVFDWAAMSVNEQTEEVLAHIVSHVMSNVLTKAVKKEKKTTK